MPAGQEEVETAVRLLEEEGRKLRRSQLKLRLHPVPLYAGLPAAHQLGVFEPAPRGYRKVGTVRALEWALQGAEGHRWASVCVL